MTENTLTKREIFEQIKILQNQLTENPFLCLDGMKDVFEQLDESGEAEDNVSKVCAVYAMREETLRSMLKLYEKMYDDISE